MTEKADVKSGEDTWKLFLPLCVCVFCSATLLAFLVELLKSSVAMQEQMLGGKGFLVIGYLLEKVSGKASALRSLCCVLCLFVAG